MFLYMSDMRTYAHIYIYTYMREALRRGRVKRNTDRTSMGMPG